MKKIAISQSNYIPWKGYFDMIGMVDEFVLYDCVQYTRRDWRNRNLIKSPKGLKWLTIPVSAEYFDPIQNVTVADKSWPEQHWNLVKQHLGNTPYFGEVCENLENLYHEAGKYTQLSDVNRHFLTGLNALLNIDTVLTPSREYNTCGVKSERLISICKQAGADVYLSGPAAKAYLDVKQFNDEGIDVEWMDYSGYPEYPQLFGEFEHSVSVIDLICNTGSDAETYVKIHQSVPAEDIQ